uniref:Uncharacterized protein n=2 Tax=viral metagenome TaxID=1070528 RepID=A0A6H1ZYK1_9ZZZZ
MKLDALEAVKSSTIGIKVVLKPYWKSKALEDQHWILVLKYLQKIEEACNEDGK